MSDSSAPRDWTADASADGVRLQKLMAAAGVASRRVSENLIAAGRVAVNGDVVTDPRNREPCCLNFFLDLRQKCQRC